ncbi:hypothetical protein [Alkalihalobacillus sp. BA299]|uniref:hypothetical protein n=1 Tax=Alkalihalobacillus sp. BA299 TaxID=2815938 RepID=UPI001ADD1D49|nr:hypothetical protein [Alkalihalobacillus sp. BA299]
MQQPFIEITGIKVGEHSVPVPPGLSELIHRANAWVVLDKEPEHKDYHREVIKKDGKLITILTKKEKVKKEA